jgi:signal transduction histidine kinase
MPFSEPQASELFERFLQLPTGNLELALSGASDLIAAALGADKVDAFLYDPERESMVALGTSRQPLSALQKRSGLDVLPLANGGRVVEAFKSSQPFLANDSADDAAELLGIREVLKVRSQLLVPFELGGHVQGVLGAASQQPNRWGATHLHFARAVARWVGIVAHRAQLIADLERSAVEAGRRAAADELVTTVAHDLRNYLSPLQLRIDALRRRAERDVRADDLHDAQLATKTLGRISGLITDLLDVARIDHGLLALASQPVDLVALTEDIASTISTEQQTVQVDAAEKVVAAVDPARIRQCLENLVSNAIKHGPDTTAVTLRVSREQRASGAWARIDVIDEGQGIPEQLLPHIFERFVRGKRPRGTGLGLGLFLAKRIAVAHLGDLTVDSAPGRGSRFTLTLPLND